MGGELKKKKKDFFCVAVQVIVRQAEGNSYSNSYTCACAHTHVHPTSLPNPSFLPGPFCVCINRRLYIPSASVSFKRKHLLTGRCSAGSVVSASLRNASNRKHKELQGSATLSTTGYCFSQNKKKRVLSRVNLPSVYDQTDASTRTGS